MFFTLNTIQSVLLASKPTTLFLKSHWLHSRRRLRAAKRNHPIQLAAFLTLFLLIGSVCTSSAIVWASEMVDTVAEEWTGATANLTTPLPETLYLRALPDNIAVRRFYPLASDSGSLHSLRVVPHADGNDTSIYLDQQELFRFRPTATTPNAYPEALATARKLHELLIAGHSPDTLKVIMADDKALLQLGNTTVTELDAEQATAANMGTPQKLAGVWLGHLRGIFGQRPTAKTKPDAIATVGPAQTGKASWYGAQFHGRRTASGERFDMNGLTGAHRTLPFGTLVQVTNRNNGKHVVVKINDRGPFSHGRIIDVSKGAAAKIGLDRSGVAPVSIAVVGKNVAITPTPTNTRTIAYKAVTPQPVVVTPANTMTVSTMATASVTPRHRNPVLTMPALAVPAIAEEAPVTFTASPAPTPQHQASAPTAKPVS